MSVMAFYETAESRLEAMKLQALKNNPNWVTLWDLKYKKN